MEFFKKNKFKIIAIIAACLIIILLIFNNNKNEKFNEVVKSDVNVNQSECIVEIKGEVNKSGIYSVSSESRVNDIIILAGGFTKNADTSRINLAERITDGMVIIIPSLVQEEEQSNLININKASKEELMSLSGIGESKAQAIITYRNDNNGFRSIEELLKVNGISEKLYLSIKDKITV